jgi:hypothetical protein
MYKQITLTNLIPIFLIGFILASIPTLFFFYFAFLILLTKIFIIICIIDFIRKTSIRKKTGLILGFMFIAGIISVITMFVLHSFNR